MQALLPWVLIGAAATAVVLVFGRGAPGEFGPPAAAPTPAPCAEPGPVSVEFVAAPREVLPRGHGGDRSAREDQDREEVAAPETEREFISHFRSQLDKAAVVDAAEQLLEEPGPDCRRVALLKVLWERDQVRASASFTHAVRVLPGGSTPHAESVSSFAIGFLAERAARSAPARAALEQIAFGGTRTEAALRRRAAAALARVADPSALARLPTLVLRTGDEAMTEAVGAALAGNPHASDAGVARVRLGLNEQRNP